MIIDSKKMNSALYVMTGFMLIVQFLINDIGFSTEVILLLDCFIVGGFIFVMMMLPTKIRKAKCILPVLVIILLAIVSFVGFGANGYSFGWYINGLRITGRGFVLFLIAISLLNRENIEKIFRLFEIVLVTNVFLCTIQCFIFGYKGDYCGGLFGTAKTNSWTNILLCIIVTYSIALYINSCISIKKAIVNCFFCVYISSLAEIKFFFFEMILIVLVLILLNKPNKRTIAICVISGLLLISMTEIVNLLWSDSSSNIFSIEGIKYYLTEKSYGYASVGDLGRIGGISKLNKLFFGNSINLFGMGLGSCEYGTMFYSSYSYLHYIWFGYLMIYLEMGWCGLILYVFFFISIIVASYRKRCVNMSLTPYQKSIHIFSECMAIIGIVLMWYNTTVINYPGFFLFLVISFAFKIDCE